MSTQPRRSARLAAQPVVTASSKSSISTQPIQQQPRRSARLASKMIVTQPVTQSTLKPRRSRRLAIKRHASIISLARHFLLPLLNQLETTRGLNPRAHLILQIMNYFTIFPTILVLSPKMRNTCSERMKLIWDQIKTNRIIDMTLKNDIELCFITLQQTLVDIQSHPDYVS